MKLGDFNTYRMKKEYPTDRGHLSENTETRSTADGIFPRRQTENGNIISDPEDSSKHPEKGCEKPRGLCEYSKRILCAMVALWFIGAAFGGGVVVWQLISGSYYVSLDSLMNYIGYPMSGGIVGYLIKSALENREKIRARFANRPSDTDMP